MEAAPAGPLGVAVSGGGDSLALLLLFRDWAASVGRRIEAVTIDHGLRHESGAEAEAVAARCARLGVGHAVLTWQGWDRRGNLQAEARAARQRLIGEWAAARGIGAVALGHTLDDQAETFLMRLARGSGVDGLACMAPVARDAAGVVWLRPLLGVRRAVLRDWLDARGEPWVEDPGNADPAFDRVRARAALGPLSALGLGPERLTATAEAMARAGAALNEATCALASASLAPGPAGDLRLDPGPLASASEEIRLRLVAGALAWVAGSAFRPRLAHTLAATAAIREGRVGAGLTLHGCVLRRSRGAVAIRREPARVAPPVPLAAGVWDRRWRVTGPEEQGLTIGALGAEGLAERPGWRDHGLAREALLTVPGLWRGARLVAAPLLDPGCRWQVRRIAPRPAPWQAGELR